MASKQTSGAAALRYATALVDIAGESKKIDSVEQDLRDLSAMIAASSDFQTLIKSPLISRKEQQDAVQAIAKKAKFQDITVNFLSLLAQNRRLDIVEAIANAVHEMMSKRRGEVNAKVQSAFKLSPAQEKALREALEKAVGKAVAVQVEVDKDLIGGMVVTMGSQMIDDSVKRKLERLKIAMSASANTNTQSAKAANEG
ncbi:MAG: F0F1 ATP synthase subunit delta [Alphaproteobacteria bacterium]|nr:F0F1 ATP synthase subunit delta [Alphaproteobacteria bacterium]